MSQFSISEADLHAYVDSVLPEARRREMDEYLAAQPGEADRVQVYRAQKQVLRELFNPIIDEPVPDRLCALAFAPPRSEPDRSRRLPRWSLLRVAASVLIALIGGAAGWLGHGQLQQVASLTRASPFARQAAVAHAVYSPDVRRPVEVSAEHEDQLVAWLSKRLGTPVRPPKLGALGYELIGGRLLPGNSGPVAQFMYHDASEQRLTLYVSTENTSNEETAFRFAQEGTVNVFYWIDGKFGYALSASIEKDELARIASAVYEQIERK